MSGYSFSQHSQNHGEDSQDEYTWRLTLDSDAERYIEVVYSWCRKNVIQINSIDENGMGDFVNGCGIALFDHIFEWCERLQYYVMDNCEFVTDVYFEVMTETTKKRQYRETMHSSGKYTGFFPCSLAHKSDVPISTQSSTMEVVLLPWHNSTADYWARIEQFCSVPIQTREQLELALIALHGGKKTDVSENQYTFLAGDWAQLKFLQELIRSAPTRQRNDCNWEDYSVLPRFQSKYVGNTEMLPKTVAYNATHDGVDTLLLQLYNITAQTRFTSISNITTCQQECISVFQMELDLASIPSMPTKVEETGFPTCFTGEKPGMYIDPVSSINNAPWGSLLQLSRPTVCSLLACSLLGHPLYTSGSSCLGRDKKNRRSNLNYYRTVETVHISDEDILNSLGGKETVYSVDNSAGGLAELFRLEHNVTTQKQKCLRVYFQRMQLELDTTDQLGVLEYRLGSTRVDVFATIQALCLDSVALSPEQRHTMELRQKQVYSLDSMLVPRYIVGDQAQEVLAYVCLNSHSIPKGAVVGCTHSIPVKKSTNQYTVKCKYLNTNNLHQLDLGLAPDAALEIYDTTTPILDDIMDPDEELMAEVVSPVVTVQPAKPEARGILKFFQCTSKPPAPKPMVATIPTPTKPLTLTHRDQCILQQSTPTYPDRQLLEDDAVVSPLCDFANKYIGGGVLGRGCVQEEIQFVVFPECLLSLMFCDKMNTTHAITIAGARQYSTYTGYASGFQCTGAYCTCPTVEHTHCTLKQWKEPNKQGNTVHSRNVESLIVAIDALHYNQHGGMQFDQLLVWREFTKVTAAQSIPTGWRTHLKEPVCHNYTAFRAPVSYTTTYDTPEGSINYDMFATGNWGCGVFNGDRQQKAIVQLLACACYGKTMKYFTLTDEPIQSLPVILSIIYSQKLSIRRLFIILALFLQMYPRELMVDENNRHFAYKKIFGIHVSKEQYIPNHIPKSPFQSELLKTSERIQTTLSKADKRVKLDPNMHKMPSRDHVKDKLARTKDLFTFLKEYVNKIQGGNTTGLVTLPNRK